MQGAYRKGKMVDKWFFYDKNGNLKEASRNLFHFLHRLDQSKCKKIAIAPIPNIDLGLTINDRIKRASKK